MRLWGPDDQPLCIFRDRICVIRGTVLLGSVRCNIVRNYRRALLCGALALRQKGAEGYKRVLCYSAGLFTAAGMPGSWRLESWRIGKERIC